MAPIRLKLQALLTHYELSRGAGHTTALLDGARAVRPLILTGTLGQKQALVDEGVPRADVLFLGGLDALEGKTDRSLVIDTSALCYLLREADETIARLESENARLLRSARAAEGIL